MFICLFIDCFIDWLYKKPASLFLTFKHMGKKSVLEKIRAIPSSRAVYQWQSQHMQNTPLHSASWTGLSLFSCDENDNRNENHLSSLHHPQKLMKYFHTHILTSSCQPCEKESWGSLVCPVRTSLNVLCDSVEVFRPQGKCSCQYVTAILCSDLKSPL